MSKIVYLALAPLALFALGALWGCGSDAPPAPSAAKAPLASASQKAQSPLSETSSKPTTVLKVPFPSEPTAPSVFIVGHELGFFKKRGVELDFVGVIPTTQLVAAVVSGQIDVSHGSHVNRTIAGVSAGAKILAVVAGTETTQRVPHMTAIVPKNSPIKTPQDLLGKKVGLPTIGGCNEYTPYAWLDKNGVSDPKTKIEVTVVAEKNLEQVLRQGEIDLAMMHKIPEEILKKGEFDVVFSDYDVWGPDGGNTPQYFSIQYIKDHPEAVQAFVAAVAETHNWANANPKGAMEITARRTGQDINRIAERFYAPDGLIKPETVEVWIQLLTHFGEIKPGISLDRIYTNEFNPHYQKAS